MQANSPPTTGASRSRKPLLAMLAGAVMALAGAGLILWLQLMIYVPAVEQGRLVAIGIPALLLIDAFGVGLFAIGLATATGAWRASRQEKGPGSPTAVPGR